MLFTTIFSNFSNLSLSLYILVYTYIQSRFYRSPDIILGLDYTSAIDMFSLGCILAEFYTGYPLFPGENEKEQLACIMEILGLPPQNVLDKSTRLKLFFGKFKPSSINIAFIYFATNNGIKQH